MVINHPLLADRSEQGMSQTTVCLCRPHNKGQCYSCPCAHCAGIQGEERYSSTTGVRSASHPGQFTVKHDCAGDWTRSTTDLKVLEKKRYVSPPGTETQSVHPTVCSPYQLCCPNSGTVLYISINLYAPCILYIGQAYRYSPEYAFYIFSQQIYYLIIFFYTFTIFVYSSTKCRVFLNS